MRRLKTLYKSAQEWQKPNPIEVLVRTDVEERRIHVQAQVDRYKQRTICTVFAIDMSLEYYPLTQALQ